MWLSCTNPFRSAFEDGSSTVFFIYNDESGLEVSALKLPLPRLDVIPSPEILICDIINFETFSKANAYAVAVDNNIIAGGYNYLDADFYDPLKAFIVGAGETVVAELVINDLVRANNSLDIRFNFANLDVSGTPKTPIVGEGLHLSFATVPNTDNLRTTNAPTQELLTNQDFSPPFWIKLKVDDAGDYTFKDSNGNSGPVSSQPDTVGVELGFSTDVYLYIAATSVDYTINGGSEDFQEPLLPGEVTWCNSTG